MKLNEYLLDSLNICKKNPLLFVPLAGAVVLVTLLTMLLGGPAIPFAGTMDMQQVAAGAGAALGSAMVLSILSTLITFLAHGMTIALGHDAIQGLPVSLRKGWERAAERIVPLVIAVILVGLLIGIGMVLLVLPGLVAAFFLMFTFAAIMVDGKDALRALRSSISLVAGNLGTTLILFFVLIALSVIFMLLNMILSMIPVAGTVVAIVVSAVFSTYLTLVVLHAYLEIRQAPPEPTI
jgi:hypothetical protein